MNSENIVRQLVDAIKIDAFRNQLNDPKFKEVPFEDRFGMLVDIEYSLSLIHI